MLNSLQIFCFHFFSIRRELCRKTPRVLWGLAQRVLSKSCANIIYSLRKLLNSEDFLTRHKNSPTAFTRNRKLPFPTLVCFLINFVKSSYQNELDQFFKALSQFQVAKRIVSKAALCKARSKLSFKAFIELNRHLTAQLGVHFRLKRWRGFRLVALDGSTCRVPKIKEIANHFGICKGTKGNPSPMARVSQLFDTLNKISIAAIITPIHIDERPHAHKLFFNLMPRDLVLLDRGYPAFWLFKDIVGMQADFCARIGKRWKTVLEFLDSDLTEQVVTLSPPISSIQMCKDYGLDTEPITVRLMRIELDSGEVEVLITSLIDSQLYPYSLFKELYHKR